MARDRREGALMAPVVNFQVLQPLSGMGPLTWATRFHLKPVVCMNIPAPSGHTARPRSQVSLQSDWVLQHKAARLDKRHSSVILTSPAIWIAPTHPTGMVVTALPTGPPALVTSGYNMLDLCWADPGSNPLLSHEGPWVTLDFSCNITYPVWIKCGGEAPMPALLKMSEIEARTF